MHIFSICVIGDNLWNYPIWRKPNFYIHFIPTPTELESNQDYDIIFLSTPVEWLPDGTFNDNQLVSDVEIIHNKGYYHQLIVTALMPMGVCSRLQCNYFPLPNTCDDEPLLFGCDVKILFDPLFIYGFLSTLFSTRQYEIRSTNDTEIMFLIHICQSYINRSFQREISFFCNKNNINRITSHDIHHNLSTPILVYMVRQMEEIKIDCPILYSCLFRQRYIDITI